LMIGLRIGEATRVNVSDLHSQAGDELFTIMGKGGKLALPSAGEPAGWR
jgi:hypothetical protein